MKYTEYHCMTSYTYYNVYVILIFVLLQLLLFATVMVDVLQEDVPVGEVIPSVASTVTQGRSASMYARREMQLLTIASTL